MSGKRPIDKQEPKLQKLLIKALDNTPKKLISETDDGPVRNDIYWSAFFASDDLMYLNKIIEQLKYLNERKDVTFI